MERRLASCGIIECRWHKLPQDNHVFQHLMNKQFQLIIERNYEFGELAIYWQMIADA